LNDLVGNGNEIYSNSSLIHYFSNNGLDLSYLNKFSAGGGGVLYLYQDSDNSFIVKTPNYSKYEKSRYYVAEKVILKEKSMLEKFKSKHLPSLIDWDDDGKFLIREYLSGTSLEAKINYGLELSKRIEIIAKIIGMAKSLFTLFHKNNEGCYVVRDIKPANIIIDKELNLFFVDLGSVRKETEMFTKTSRRVLGTRKWLYWPPEQLLENKEKTNRKFDFFSLGSTLFYVLTGAAPYSNSEQNKEKLMELYFSEFGICQLLIEEYVNKYSFPQDIANFISECIAPCVNDRLCEIPQYLIRY